MNVPRWRRVLGGLVLMGLMSAGQATEYYDSPRASDADKIATQMLNDAASGRFRGGNFGRPYNPFDQMIADLENKRRAQWAQREQDRQESIQRANEAEAEERYQQQVRAVAERRQAALRAQAAREERRRLVAELERQVADGDAAASLDLGVLAEGNFQGSGLLVLPSGMDARSFARSRYEKAYHWGHDLGLVALACSTAGETPDFASLYETVATLPDEVRRREHLQRLASRGHVGANLWLGAWHSGRFVGLGIPPEPGKNADDVRRAIGYLDRARTANWELAGAWYAEAVLAGTPKPGERAEALSILERLVEKGLAKNPAAAPALTYEWLRNARVASDLERPLALMRQMDSAEYLRGRAAVARIYLEGLTGEFHPGLAAQACGRIPDRGRWSTFAMQREVASGIDAWLGVDGPKDAREALERMDRAVAMVGRTTGGVLPEHRMLKVEAQLWQAFLRLELGATGAAARDAKDLLVSQRLADERLGHLMDTYLDLSNRTSTRMDTQGDWFAVDVRNLFTSRMAPVETWLALQCVRLAHERGVAPDAGPFIPEIRALSPKDAPTKGAALLARMYFTRIHTRDVSMRSGVATVYAALVKAAWRDPSLWAQVAALVEAVQIEPLTPEQWRAGWLAPMLENHPGASPEQRLWAEQVMLPSQAGWVELAKLRSGRGSLSLREWPEVQAMKASLTLRFSKDRQEARAAFRQLLALGEARSWHALAMLEEFRERYAAGYAGRDGLADFRRDVRESAEWVATWRENGHGCMTLDPSLRSRAIGRALANGSKIFTTEPLQAAAHWDRMSEMALLEVKAAGGVSKVDRADFGWLPEDQRVLVKAAVGGDAGARRHLVDSGWMLPGLIGLTPDEWVKRAQGRLADRSSALRWTEVAEAVEIWRTGQPYWDLGSAAWVEAARTLGEVAVAALGTDLPAGRSWDELGPLYDIGIEGGHGPSFVKRVTQLQMDINSKDLAERTELRDRVIIDLSRKLLERDPANVLFLEETARPRLRDEALWNVLLWGMGHYQDKSGTPSSLLEFIRKSAPPDAAGKQAVLQPVHRGFRFGRTGERLLTAAREKRDPQAMRALLDLGVKEKDWDRMRKSR